MKISELKKEIEGVFKQPVKKYYFGSVRHGAPYFYPKQGIKHVELGWKDKYKSPRFEWTPQFHIRLVNLQFVIWWNAPDGDNDKYYEMILWYLHYADKNIVKAESTWPWIDFKTKQSTWNKNYLL